MTYDVRGYKVTTVNHPGDEDQTHTVEIDGQVVGEISRGWTRNGGQGWTARFLNRCIGGDPKGVRQAMVIACFTHSSIKSAARAMGLAWADMNAVVTEE